MALDIPRLEAHRAGLLTGGVAGAAIGRAAAIEADHHGLLVGHPGDTLKHAHRTGEATEQMPGKQKLDTQDDRRRAEKNDFVAGQFETDQVRVDLRRRQQVGQKHHRP